MEVKEFDYHLPQNFIAQYPREKRESSRLMVLHRKERRIEHRTFSGILDYLEEGDVLVVNQTKVVPARLRGRKESGGEVELLLVRRVPSFSKKEGEGREVWECLVKSSSLKPGSKIYFSESLKGKMINARGNGRREICLFFQGKLDKILEKIGEAPLPPYLKREKGAKPSLSDKKRYQTIFARKKGAIAAPTAGLHFSKRLTSQIEEKGVKILPLTLHVGIGSFLPMRAERVEEHLMEAEYYELSKRVANLINKAKKEGRKVFSVGTTTTRALEFAGKKGGVLEPGRGYTDLFIYPGYNFKIIDALITNFHLPKSTPILLVSAFAGKDFILKAYQKAIERGYRFYSFGDGTLVL